MNRNNILSARALSAALIAAGALSLAVGCTPKDKTADEDAAAQMTTPANNLRSGLPPDAVQVGQESESPTFTPDKPGRVYIYDRTANRTISSYQVRKGQELIVSGQEGRATLDGNDVAVGEIKTGRTYLLYFLDPTAMGESSGNGSNSGQNVRIIPMDN